MEKHFLGLDWGKAKVGTALADDETRMAFSHSILKNDATIFENLSETIRENNVETVVIGVPSHYLHTENLGDGARSFGMKSAEKCHVEVVFFQEMFTTKMAQSNLAESGRRGQTDDKEAARIILQEWLDNQKREMVEKT